MSSIVLVHLVLVSAYAGFQWTVRVVVYPQFAGVGAAEFPAYEAAHQRRISLVVGPLFAGQVVTTALLFTVGAPLTGAVAAVVLLVGILAVTAFVAVPLHRTLSSGFSRAAFGSLLRIDLVRALLATANAAVALALAA